MLANMVSALVTNETAGIELAATEPSLLLNLTAIFPKGQVTAASHGRPVQVDPWVDRVCFPHLNLMYDEPLSNFAFNSNMRRYTTATRQGLALAHFSPQLTPFWSVSRFVFSL